MVAFLLAALLVATERLPFECTAEDIRSFGLTCPHQQPCAVYLEIAGMDAAGANLLVAGNLHTEDATLFSVLLASPDGGKTWQEPHERVHGAGLELVQYLDFEHAFVGGEVLGGVPRDPFLLITTDGGKTWSQQPLFSELRAGVLNWFQFDSATHGLLELDRTQSGESGRLYEEYETSDGGRTWKLLGAADQAQHPGPRRVAPAGWRLRADARSKTFRVERREANAWEPVASFAVHVGACREPEPAFAEPADEAEPEAPATPPAPKPRGKRP